MLFPSLQMRISGGISHRRLHTNQIIAGCIPHTEGLLVEALHRDRKPVLVSPVMGVAVAVSLFSFGTHLLKALLLRLIIGFLLSLQELRQKEKNMLQLLVGVVADDPLRLGLWLRVFDVQGESLAIAHSGKILTHSCIFTAFLVKLKHFQNSFMPLPSLAVCLGRLFCVLTLDSRGCGDSPPPWCGLLDY